jgi:thiol-disulfide isomerase/thioredoxin
MTSPAPTTPYRTRTRSRTTAIGTTNTPQRQPWSQIVYFAFIGIAAIGVYSFITTARDGEARSACSALCALQPNYGGRDRTFPAFTLKDIAGNQVSSTSFAGKTVVINFWSKTCRPCLEEMPALSHFAQVLKNENIAEFISISIDSDPADVRNTLVSVLGSEPPFLTLVDGDSALFHGKLGATKVPETWFVDGKGVIRVRVDGPRDWSGSMTVEVAKMVGRPSGCELDFVHGKAEGQQQYVCQQLGFGAVSN